MSDKRKKKLQARAARRRKPVQRRRSSAEFVAPPDISIQREVDYIIKCAAERDARLVSLGSILSFSTASGDAWLLDPADGLALCLAKVGEPQPRRIVETETTFAIEWDRTYGHPRNEWKIGGVNFKLFLPQMKTDEHR